MLKYLFNDLCGCYNVSAHQFYVCHLPAGVRRHAILAICFLMDIPSTEENVIICTMHGSIHQARIFQTA